MILNAKKFRTLTDGSERSLPAGSVGSVITCATTGSDLVIQATVNGIRGEGGRNVGFAQLKMDVDSLPVESDFVVEFEADATSERKWSVVLQTNKTQRLDHERGDGAIMTFQAMFTPGPAARRFTLAAADFKAVIRGRELGGDFALTRGGPRLITLGFQITRNAIAEGRDNLNPIDGNLKILGGVLDFKSRSAD